MYTPPQPQTIETKVAILEEKLHTTEQLMQRIESAIEKMSEVSASVTKMLAVHEQKIESNDKVDTILFAKIDQLSSKMDTDHNIVLNKLQGLEKKVWVGIGVLAAISFTINNSGLVRSLLTPEQDRGTIERLK
jgi:methionine synthase II (cobalamin-independent)